MLGHCLTVKEQPQERLYCTAEQQETTTTRKICGQPFLPDSSLCFTPPQQKLLSTQIMKSIFWLNSISSSLLQRADSLCPVNLNGMFSYNSFFFFKVHLLWSTLEKREFYQYWFRNLCWAVSPKETLLCSKHFWKIQSVLFTCEFAICEFTYPQGAELPPTSCYLCLCSCYPLCRGCRDLQNCTCNQHGFL